MKPVFAIKDRAIDGYGDPFSQPSTQHALRWFRDQVNSDPAGSGIAAHPDDYDLYSVGTYDQDTGQLTAVFPPQLAGRGKDLVNPKE